MDTAELNISLEAKMQSLAKRHGKTMDLSLERVRLVFEAMNLSEWPCPIIHVAGSNGKGTAVAALNAIYSQAGYRVGVFTSPHLFDYCERIRVGDQLISEQDFLAALEQVSHSCDSISLTLFESVFLAALVYFSRQSIDLMVIEVGLGGRLDATNVLNCDYGVITSISLDHQDYLGDHVEAIAYEKGGIIKPAMKELVHAVEEHRDLFDAMGEKHGVKVSSLGRDFFCQERESCHWRCGSHKVQWMNKCLHASNLACVLKLVSSLSSLLPLDWTSLSACLSGLTIPGRRQQWSHRPVIWLDVAHNQASSESLHTWIVSQDSSAWVAVVAIQKTKAFQDVLAPWLQTIDQWWCVDQVADTMISADNLGQYLKGQGCRKVKQFATMEDIVKKTRDGTSLQAPVIVFGSFLTVASFVRHWNAID